MYAKEGEAAIENLACRVDARPTSLVPAHMDMGMCIFLYMYACMRMYCTKKICENKHADAQRDRCLNIPASTIKSDYYNSRQEFRLRVYTRGMVILGRQLVDLLLLIGHRKLGVGIIDLLRKQGGDEGKA